MKNFIEEICRGYVPYEFIIQKALDLHKNNNSITFRELIDQLNSNGIDDYATERGVSCAIREIFRRSVIAYRDYDKEGDFDKKDKADMICEAVAFAYTRNNGDIAWY